MADAVQAGSGRWTRKHTAWLVDLWVALIATFLVPLIVAVMEGNWGWYESLLGGPVWFLVPTLWGAIHICARSAAPPWWKGTNTMLLGWAIISAVVIFIVWRWGELDPVAPVFLAVAVWILALPALVVLGIWGGIRQKWFGSVPATEGDGVAVAPTRGA